MSFFLLLGIGSTLRGEEELPTEVVVLQEGLTAKKEELRKALIVQLEVLKESHAKAKNFTAVGEAHTLVEAFSKKADTKVREPGDAGLKKLIFLYDARVEKLDGIYRAELVKLERSFERSGKRVEAKQIRMLVGEFDLETFRDAPLAQIKVKATVRVSAEKLVEGTARLSGGFRPRIGKVDESLQGSEFLRVPWQSKPVFTIEGLEDGNLFVVEREPGKLTGLSVASEPLKGLVKGDWINRAIFHRVYLREGEKIVVSSAEGMLIAGTIKVN
ncbi:MAG: hypothetical protein ACSHYF_12295 [Verrucomicrobiaceae bacterium]